MVYCMLFCLFFPLILVSFCIWVLLWKHRDGVFGLWDTGTFSLLWSCVDWVHTWFCSWAFPLAVHTSIRFEAVSPVKFKQFHQSNTFTSFRLFVRFYTTQCVCVCVCGFPLPLRDVLLVILECWFFSVRKQDCTKFLLKTFLKFYVYGCCMHVYGWIPGAWRGQKRRGVWPLRCEWLWAIVRELNSLGLL